MMTRNINDEEIKALREQYPVDAKIQLISMNDPYTKLPPDAIGTVTGVDDMGTVHVNWDCGSSLGVVYGEDLYKRVVKECPSVVSGLSNCTVCKFDTRGQDSELNDRTGQTCVVIRPLTQDEADIEDVGNMYRVHFVDGAETDAFEDELKDREKAL